MNIGDVAREIIKFREASKQLLNEDNIDAWIASWEPIFATTDRLRALLLERPFVATEDPAVKEILSGIELKDIEDKDTVGSELLFSLISPAEYVAGLAQVQVLIAPFQIPANLECFLEEARQCYAFGQYAAVQSLSRTILETAVTDIGVRIRKLPAEILTQNMSRKYPAEQRIRIVAAADFETVYSHYRDLCPVAA